MNKSEIEKILSEYVVGENYSFRAIPQVKSIPETQIESIAERLAMNGWRSVKDELPEKSGAYLCYRPDSEYIIWVTYFGRIDKSFKPTYVTHWMPLPEKPM